jgi:hypothetical protein
MIAHSRLKSIQGLARTKLRENNRLKLPVKPKDFASSLGFTVMPFEPSEPDISGFLMQCGNEFGIGYSTAIQNEGFQNFTIAHELGHYFIDGHLFAVLQDDQHFSRSGFISKDRFEMEADAFATELLMPWALIEPIVRKQPPGFGAIKSVSDACESSILASAVRYSQVTNECVAVIVSFSGAVEFMTASDSFKQIPGLDWLRKRDSIPPTVPSARYSSNREWIKKCLIDEEGSKLNEWFPNAPDLEISEDIVGLGSYGRLLTILFSDSVPDDELEEEHEEDDYIKRMKEGRFRGKNQ